MTKDNPGQTALSEAEKAQRRARNAVKRAEREAKAAARAQAAAKPKNTKSGKNTKPPAPSKDAKGGKNAKAAASAKTAKIGKNSPMQPQYSAKSAINRPAAAQKPTANARNRPIPDITHNIPQIPFNILIVAQAGRLEREACLFVESLRANAPGWQGRLIVAEPRSEAAWDGVRTAISAPVRAVLEARGAEIIPFTARHFGASYPQGNKIEALALLPEGENFIFFDTDTLITGPLDRIRFEFTRPSASMRREGTWPEPPLYGPGYGAIWQSLYDRFGLDYESSLDTSQPDEFWGRYLYFNAGWFFGADPAVFGQRLRDWALAVRADPGDALASQSLDPWLDQVVLPLVIHSLGGGRPGPELDGLDGEITCHWRELPLLYARECEAAVEAMEEAAHAPDIQPLLAGWEPAARLIYEENGRDALRPAIDRDHLPLRERALRQEIKRAGWWVV